MTGNHPGRSGNPARRANPGLDQIAAQIRNDRRGGHPELAALLGVEDHLLRVFAQHAGEQVEPAQAGATMLVIGQLFNQVVSQLPAEEFQRAPGLMVNLLRMMGQRLYTGDLPDSGLQCPYPLASGAACSFRPRSSMGGTLTAVMRGHVELHHPGQTWPPADDDQADAEPSTSARLHGVCDFGHPRAERLTTSPNGNRFDTYAELYCPTCEQPHDHHFERVTPDHFADCSCGMTHTEYRNAATAALEAKRAAAQLTLSEAAPLQLVAVDQADDDHGQHPPAGHAYDEDEQHITGTDHDQAETIARETELIQGAVEHARRNVDPTPAVLGQCPDCERRVPLERPSVVASHCIEGAHIECPGTGREPVEYAGAPFDAEQWTPPAGYTVAAMTDRAETIHPFDAKPFGSGHQPLSGLLDHRGNTLGGTGAAGA